MDDKSEIKEKHLLLAATAAPAISYWLAYLFQYGYCQRLNIPINFIDIGLTDILFFFFCLVVFTFYSSTVSEPFHSIQKNIPEIVKSKIRLTFSPLILMGVYLFTFKINEPIYIYPGLFIISVIFIYEFIFPIFTSKNGLSYISKLDEAQKRDFEYESKTDEFANTIGGNNYSYLFTLAKLSVLSLFIGSFYAYSKSEFMVSSNESEIALMKYKDYFIMAKYDSDSNTYESQLRVVPISEIAEFSYRKIKNLKEK